MNVIGVLSALLGELDQIAALRARVDARQDLSAGFKAAVNARLDEEVTRAIQRATAAVS